MTAEELKKLCDVSTSVTVDARFRDLQLCENQPRVVTANGMTPFDWHTVFPQNLFEIHADERLRLSSDAEAVGKRIAWAFVQHNLISQSMRDNYNHRASAVVSAVAAVNAGASEI